MTGTKKRINYKGYKLQAVSQNMVLLYMPKSNNMSYALSFDGGKTWSIGRNKRNIKSNCAGSPTEIIDICIKCNTEGQNEEQ